ncbi:hypothetical protein [Antrihabitans cavernicola]|uniref:Uncharacterized protein n=1 Tax=Antrihabitans cavernicola TaxID=2495913 RepID=A0A5A7S740_9NOCA|nr:hypothetical protein [Spelaeibacter cavernicola]KAA0021960.1 hypothetical protein FOY51_16375 [Spelaeibacter cavernicola]
MSFWLTALAVWISAGSRVGRVLVRPATTIRIAILIAVACVAFASTVAIPDVADSIDRIVAHYPREPVELAATIGLILWLCFTAAASVIAAAAWPVTSRKSLRETAYLIYGTGVVVILLSLLYAPIGWLVVAIGCTFVVITGVQNLDWTPLGRGIAVFTAGTAAVALFALLQFFREITDGVDFVHRAAPTWGWSLASILISVGAIWILVESFIKARLLLRRVGTLHTVMTERFPEVLEDDGKYMTSVLRSSDQVANIMDALYLQAGGGSYALDHSLQLPTDNAQRASAVARWARDPLNAVPVDTRWITPPEGISTRRWVGDIAKAYGEEGGAHSTARR